MQGSMDYQVRNLKIVLWSCSNISYMSFIVTAAIKFDECNLDSVDIIVQWCHPGRVVHALQLYHWWQAKAYMVTKAIK